jgi:DNA repair protein RecO (recombination protein O)
MSANVSSTVSFPAKTETMALVSSDAIILQAFAYGDTSRILRLLTSTHGMQSVIAKGARGPRGRFGGVLEPFTEGVATYYAKATRDLHTLSGFELTQSGQGLGTHLLRFGGASLLAEIVICATRESSHPGLYEVVRGAMHRLAAEPDAGIEAAVLGETWILVSWLGFTPELDSCIDCGRPIAPDETATFDYAAGGTRCGACSPASPGRSLPPHALAALRSFVRGEPCVLPRTEGHWWLLSRYLDHHVLEGTRLRSLDFIANTIGTPSCER